MATAFEIELARRLSPKPTTSIEDLATRQVESGDRQLDASGRPLTSRAGAIGSSQIMPGTAREAAQLAGVDYSEFLYKYDKEYNDKLGSAYLKHTISAFSGDKQKGHAAYNAGIGTIKAAVAQAEAKGGSWIDYVPTETKNYIARINVATQKLSSTSQPSKETFEERLSKISKETFEERLSRISKGSETSDNLYIKLKSPAQSQLATFSSQFARGLPGAAAFLAGGQAATTLAAPAIAASGPAAPFTGIGAFLIGGVAASIAADEVVDALLPGQVKTYLEAGKQDNRYTAIAGELASFGATSKIGLAKKLITNATTGVSKQVVDKPLALALGAVGGTFNAGSQFVSTGKVDPIEVAMNAVSSPFLGLGLNKFGKAAASLGGTPAINTRARLSEIEYDDIVQQAINTSNHIDYTHHNATNVEKLIREHVVEGATSTTDPELHKELLRELGISLGRRKGGDKAFTVIMPDSHVASWQRMMIRAIDNDEEAIKYISDFLQGSGRRPNNRVDYTLLHKGIDMDAIILAGLSPTSINKLTSTRNTFSASIQAKEATLAKKDRLGSTEYLVPALDNMRDIYDEVGKRAVEAGVIKGMLRNYAPLLIDSSNSKLSQEGIAEALEGFYKVREGTFKTDATKERLFDTARELQDYLNSIGSDLYVHTDGATVIGSYMKSMEKSIAEKKLIDTLKATTLWESGLPVIQDLSTPAGLASSFTHKYKTYNSKGSEVLNGLSVHPEYAPMLDHLFRQNDIGAVKNAFLQTAMLTKALNVVGSFFHAPSLGWAIGGASPDLAFKEIITGGSGIRKVVNQLRMGKTSEYIDLAIQSGTKIGTEDVKRTIIADLGAYADKQLFGGSKVTQRILNPVDKYVLQKMNVFTWDYMHTGGKLLLFEDLMKKSEKNLRSPVGTEAWKQERFELAKRVSNSVNHTMGGLQWLQAAHSIKGKLGRAVATKAFGKENREYGQIAMFAPDWTVSTLGAFLKGMPDDLRNIKIKEGAKGIMKPMNEADLARRYTINTGLMWLTLLNGINLATSGQFIWENDDPTRIQHSDGTTQQLSKHSMEGAHWLMDPGKTLRNKLGFFPKALLEIMDDEGGDALERAKSVGKLALPFSAGSAMQAPTGEGWKRALYSMVGVPLYGTPNNASRDIEDVITDKMNRRRKLLESKLEKVEETQSQYKKSKLKGLFSDVEDF